MIYLFRQRRVALLLQTDGDRLAPAAVALESSCSSIQSTSSLIPSSSLSPLSSPAAPSTTSLSAKKNKRNRNARRSRVVVNQDGVMVSAPLSLPFFAVLVVLLFASRSWSDFQSPFHFHFRVRVRSQRSNDKATRITVDDELKRDEEQKEQRHQ
jgi:hypothetical protein